MKDLINWHEQSLHNLVVCMHGNIHSNIYIEYRRAIEWSTKKETQSLDHGVNSCSIHGSWYIWRRDHYSNFLSTQDEFYCPKDERVCPPFYWNHTHMQSVPSNPSLYFSSSVIFVSSKLPSRSGQWEKKGWISALR